MRAHTVIAHASCARVHRSFAPITSYVRMHACVRSWRAWRALPRPLRLPPKCVPRPRRRPQGARGHSLPARRGRALGA
eukprot:1021275-Pleurochrysis_carterae.AAC.1